MNTVDIVVVIILGILAIFSLIVFVMIYIPAIAVQIQKNRHGGDLQTALQEFQNTAKPGRAFVSLIYYGYFSCVLTGNHGNDFPDRRQLALFKRYSTDEVTKAIDEIGDFI